MNNLSAICRKMTKAVAAIRRSRDVDLQARSRLAAATAAYMRGEMRSFAFDEVVDEAMENSTDDALFDVAYQLWLFYDDFVDHSVSVSPQGWEYLRRLLAFLTTDYAITKRVHRTWHRGQLVALGSLAMLIIAYHPWCNAAHWPLFLVTWLGAALAAQYGTNPPVRETSDLEEMWPFAPFLSEEDWQGHAGLLAQYRIPAYDPQEHARPHRSVCDGWAWEIPWWPSLFVVTPLRLLFRLRPHTDSVLLREEDRGQAVAAAGQASQ